MLGAPDVGDGGRFQGRAVQLLEPPVKAQGRPEDCRPVFGGLVASVIHALPPCLPRSANLGTVGGIIRSLGLQRLEVVERLKTTFNCLVRRHLFESTIEFGATTAPVPG